MNPTTKLYEINPYTIEFEAKIISQKVQEDGKTIVVLDQTAFYPTGGGQPNDTGWIDNITVLDVWKDQGIIYHLLESQGFENEQVKGKINWKRRFDFMQQHAGQHILSRAFEVLYEGETVGFHLGEETVTIDVTVPELTDEMIASLEELSNQIIMENREIKAEAIPTEQASASIKEKIPELEETIRLVNVQEFDQCACAGTHPYATGEIGLIKILDWEKYKKNSRVTFVCGKRALTFYSRFQQELMSTSKVLKTNWADVANKVAGLVTEKEEIDKTAKELRLELLASEAEKWKAKASFDGKIYWVEEIFINRPFNDLKQLAQEITQAEAYLAILATVDQDKVQFVLQRSNDIEIQMNEVIRIGLEIIGGKGGGNPKTAQGGGIADEATLHNALGQMKKHIIKESLSK